MTTVAVTTNDFDEIVLQAKKPVLVDFWAPWCAPCRAMAPILEDLAADFEGEVLIVKTDIEANPQIGERFGVSGIPAFIVFDGGEEKTRFTGTRSRSQLNSLLEEHL